jgi:hypothetical protein
LKLRIVEIAPTEATAASQTASLGMLLSVGQAAASGLAATPANSALKDVLRTAQISQKKNRVIINADLPQSLPVALLNDSPATEAVGKN